MEKIKIKKICFSLQPKIIAFQVTNESTHKITYENIYISPQMAQKNACVCHCILSAGKLQAGHC